MLVDASFDVTELWGSILAGGSFGQARRGILTTDSILFMALVSLRMDDFSQGG